MSSGQDAALPDPSLIFGGMLIDGLAAGTAAAAAAAGYAAAAACGSSIPGAVGAQPPGAEAGAALGHRQVARPASPAVKRAHAITSVASGDATAAAAVLELQPPLKRIRTDAGAEPASTGFVAAGGPQESGALDQQQPSQLQPQGGATAPGSLNAAAAAVAAAAATAETPRGGLPLSPRSTMVGLAYVCARGASSRCAPCCK